MIRILSIQPYKLISHKNSVKLNFLFAGIKPRISKKSSINLMNTLSQDFINKYNQSTKSNEQNKLQQKPKKITKGQQEQLMEIQQLKQSWLGDALGDDLYIQKKHWEDQQNQKRMNKQDQPKTKTKRKSKGKSIQNLHQSKNEKVQENIQTIIQDLNDEQVNQKVQQINLKVKGFKKDLSKTQLINNSRQFLQIVCNIFPKHQIDMIISTIKQFCNKRDLNMPQLASSGTLNQKKQKKKLERQIKLIQKITKQRQRKLFLAVKKILNQTLNDLQVIDNLINFLAHSDPYIMSAEDIHKFIYNHQEGFFEDQSKQHKSGVNLVIDKKQNNTLFNMREQQISQKIDKQIDQLIEAKKDFFKQTQQILNKPLNKKVNSGAIIQNTKPQNNQQQESLDLVNVFEQFSIDQSNIQKTKQTQKQKKSKKEKSMKLIVKKNINQPNSTERFEITQKSLHQIERILFKNKKIVQDNVIFKKVIKNGKGGQTVNGEKQNTKLIAKIQKQREQFGKNWVYAYEMPYSLNHQTCQQFINFLSEKYGDIIEYYIFPYKNMLQKRQNIMIHIQNQKKQKQLQNQQILQKNGLDNKQKLIADRLLEKIQKQKNLKLNKSSMVFKFRNFEDKQRFLLPQMRLYGVNFKTFRNIRFQQAQSKKLLALSMIPWGCSTQDLIRAINKALKPIDIEVSYQACILAKGFIFIEFDNFYQCLHSCRQLNNLPFQGQQLKVQINYGSSKIYNKKYKSALQFDHYETLVTKLKDIKCFYNNIYDDDKVV